MPSTLCRSLWGVLALLSACNVDYPSNRLQCTSDEMCPSGMHCAQNKRCSAASSSGRDDSLRTSDAGAKAASAGASGAGGTRMVMEAHATAGSGSTPDAGAGSKPGAAGAGATLIAFAMRDRSTVIGAPDGALLADLKKPHDRYPVLLTSGVAAGAVGVACIAAGILSLSLRSPERQEHGATARLHIGLGQLELTGQF